ncbi:hypothetical protein G3N95_34950 [Paraburkholderia sp. Tr-20389]|uniref:hypothetical protein n=1 Tax=Paraburkholderia sp. Tr-20389 TaxID=2703903 RepID=UPI001981D08C|nr:hypothetical protein [Paraburkholderia sp. Tr-20389]MBN3758159.1 hypothetical protein [Paraburkholderia sp. Tr-20389]
MHVWVSEMSGLARDAFYAKNATESPPISVSQSDLLLATVVDEGGDLILDETDVEALRAQSSAVLDRLVAVAVRLNGMHAESLEDAEKNSETARSGGSGSNCPATSAFR